MQKKYRVQFDLTITMDEAAIQVDERFYNPPPDEAWKERHLDPQRRLFRAVLANPDFLEQYCAYLVAAQFEGINWQEVFPDEFARESSFEQLDPAVATLGEADRQWFAEAEQEEVFAESIEEFDHGFSVTCDQVHLMEVPLGKKA